ncbi:patatin-like phospholipase family protein [Thalassotalea sp. G2M2-11]|uniref:patatin-like phospholipase family protein n=1 Tax=Thalassotalea sp. G2M2-11 TaxID=2787627 RepID=UPI0019D19A8E|nr:patatin-like phospholipase family protein [Thalassotalea sp. G2M2-11]
MSHIKRIYKDSKNALVLTGGGARAAYQVGVLSAIAKFSPRNRPIPFPIICGTSAGAINTTALACYASCFQLGVKKLEWVWKNLTTSRIYHSDPYRVSSHILKAMMASFQADYANKTPRSLLNNAPLRSLLNEVVDYKRIDNNIRKNFLSAVSVTTSSYTSGDSISFFQSESTIKPWFRAKRRGIPSLINSHHLLASAAIPLVFPSVKILNEHYGDGSVHQLSPLSPAIHLGGEKLFVIGVEQPREPLHPRENNPHPPTTATIAGHLLDGIFSDTLQSDLERMHRVNNTLSLIEPEQQQAHEGLKKIDSFVINPSHDFNAIAVEYYHQLPLTIRTLLRSMGIANDPESSIISYLLFDKHYCRHLIQLGYDDALAQEQRIREYLALN